jgi:hypothetical protein
MDLCLNKDEYWETLKSENYQFPDEPFILLFGSSHSTGICRRGDSNRIDRDREWGRQLESKSGIKVVNLSFPGINNHSIQAQIIDIYNVQGFKNCIGAVLEMRVSESILSWGVDRELWDRREETSAKKNKPISHKFSTSLNRSYYFNNENKVYRGHGQSSNVFDSVFYLRTGVVSDDTWQKQLVENQLQNHMEWANQSDENFVAPAKIKDWVAYMKLHRDLNLKNSVDLINSLSQIHGCIKLLESNGVPAWWFCWDEWGHNSKSMTQFLIEKIFESSDVMHSALTGFYDLDKGNFGATKSFVEIYGIDRIRQLECECGHLTEEFHDWVADQVYNEIKGELQK